MSKIVKGKRAAYVPPRNLYFVKVADMTIEECEREKESLEHTFDAIRACQNGISSKESIRYRDVCDRIERETGRLVSRWR